MTHRKRFSLVFGLAQALTCTAGGGTAAAQDDFYLPPPGPAAAPGTVLKERPATLATVPLFTNGGAGALRARTVLYQSTEQSGAPSVVSGTFVEPTAPWPGPGPRPLAVIAPGSPGQGDQCAPSKTLQTVAEYHPPTDLAFEFEPIPIADFINRGVAVMVTDYQGLGTRRVHTYINRKESATALLDGARAAGRLSDTQVRPDSRTVMTGYSQGGHATGAAAELAPSYAPDVNLAGVYVGGPVVDLEATLRNLDQPLMTGVVGWAINGLISAYPHLADQIEGIFNDTGKQWLRDLAVECAFESGVKSGLQLTSTYTDTGQPLFDIVEARPDLLGVVREQNLGSAAPHVPVLIQHGTADDTLPYWASYGLAERWCADGTPVQFSRWDFPQFLNGTPVNHVMTAIRGSDEQKAWLDDRLAGVPAPTNCGALP